MDIRLEHLDASGFVLDLPDSDTSGPRQLTLGRVGGLGGSLRVDPEIVRITGAEVDAGTIAGLSWPVSSALITLPQPAELSSVTLDYKKPRGDRGQPSMTGAAGYLETAGVAVATSSLEVTCALQCSALALSLASGEFEARAATLGASELVLASASQVIRGAVSVGELAVKSLGDRTIVRAANAWASELVLSSERSTLTLRELELDGGFTVKGADIYMGNASVGELELEVAFPPRETPAEPPPPPPAPPGPEPEAGATAERRDPTPLPGRIPIPAGIDLRDDIVWHDTDAIFDLRDLDRLAGSIQLGVALKALLPVVGKYGLNRTFKIPIEDGALDFVDVERQLSTLQDAFIDFAVRDGKLVLKRDIPILPTKGKTLVSWPLSPVEQALAQNRVIRLRALPRLQLPRPKRSEKKATIQEVVVDRPHVELTLNAQSANAPEHPSPPAVTLNRLDTLAVDGNLRYRAAADLKEIEATALVRHLSLTVRDLVIGSRRLSAAEIVIGELSIEFTEFDGFRPVKLVAKARDLAIRELTLRGESTS